MLIFSEGFPTWAFWGEAQFIWHADLFERRIGMGHYYSCGSWGSRRCARVAGSTLMRRGRVAVRDRRSSGVVRPTGLLS